jgi:hypothetical protein
MAAADRPWIPTSAVSQRLTIIGNPPHVGYAQSLSAAKHISNQ